MRFSKKPVVPKLGATTRVVGFVRADRKNPPKRPSRKPKLLMAKILSAKETRKAVLAARVANVAKESEVAKALRGARSRRKTQRDGRK